MSNEHTLLEMAGLYTALADRTRLRLLNLMREDEICVCFLAEVLDESQPKISRHLAYLRRAGIVKSRREGKWMHYKIAERDDAYEADALAGMLEWLWSLEKMRSDYARLAEVCCATDVPVTIAKAPRPETFAESGGVEMVSGELETYLL